MPGQTRPPILGKSSNSFTYPLTVEEVSGTNPACSGEMVRTDNEINLAKARAFKQGTAINDVDKMKTWFNDWDDVERVIKNLKDVILMVKYMNVQNVNDIYYRQAVRVSQAFGTAEDGIYDNWQSESEPYIKQNLDTKFLAFMRTYTQEVSEKISEYLQLWSGNLGVFYESAVNQGGLSAAELIIVGKIEAIGAEINTVTANDPVFTNPF